MQSPGLFPIDLVECKSIGFPSLNSKGSPWCKSRDKRATREVLLVLALLTELIHKEGCRCTSSKNQDPLLKLKTTQSVSSLDSWIKRESFPLFFAIQLKWLNRVSCLLRSRHSPSKAERSKRLEQNAARANTTNIKLRHLSPFIEINQVHFTSLGLLSAPSDF